jgi:hypothetical protein
MPVGTWRESLELVRRPEDGERLGYLRELGGSLFEPLNLLGIPLGEPGSREDAVSVVQTEGLKAIDQRWWVRAPNPMVETRLDARTVDKSVDWRRMVVVELTPDRALLRSEIPWPEESGKLVSVDLPAADVLWADHPDDE